VSIYDNTINIKNISSQEIKNFLISNINFNEKEKTQYLLSLITPPPNKPLEYEMYIQVKFDTDMFNSIGDKNKLYLMKYIFSTEHLINKITNFLEIFLIFSNNKNNLIELINSIITINDHGRLEYILQRKSIKLDDKDYNNLQDIALNLRLFDINRILMRNQSLDYIL